tara:strand:- start:50 stop:325 length:276 start_codon:yes stop_codon:yes gene_type:complete
MTTTFETKTEILADLWMNYRLDEEFQDFIEYNDLGLPLAYATVQSIAKLEPQGEQMINETFELLCTAMETEDVGFDSLDDLLGFESGNPPG